jgi:hypothetical protein
MKELKRDVKAIKDKVNMSTLQDKMLNSILTAVYVTNGLLFYLCGLWTVRLFQPLKVFQ